MPSPSPDCGDSLSSGEVEAQLGRILASPDFDVPERARAFLQYVVTESLAGRADRIKAYSIAVEVFGRSATFDPQSDPIVRIEAGRLRRALERYYLTSGASDPVRIAIPKGSYVPSFASRLEEVTDSSKPATPPKSSFVRRKVWWLALSALAFVALSVGALILQRFTAPCEDHPANIDASEPNLPTLLVEPFQNLAGTADGATIALGVTGEVVEKLSKFKDLIVVPTTPGRSGERSFTAVRYILDGTVRVEGDVIRISARLIDRPHGSILWANSYDGNRTVGRLLDIETDVAGDVATALGQPYGTIFQADAAQARKGPPENWEAYFCTLGYYLYRTVLDQPTYASIKRCLERAVERFPNYATAWALLSLTYLDELRFRYNKTAQMPLDAAMEAARKAVALDPTNVRALQAQMLAFFFGNEVDAALQVGKQAVALNPNDIELVSEYGMRLALSGDWTSGCPMIEKALARNPAPQGYYETLLALCSYMQSDYQKALFWIRKADLQKNPAYHFVAAAIYGQLGDRASSEREGQWVLTNAPGFLRDIHSELPMRIKMPGDQAHFLAGLKRAGLQLPGS